MTKTSRKMGAFLEYEIERYGVRSVLLISIKQNCKPKYTPYLVADLPGGSKRFHVKSRGRTVDPAVQTSRPTRMFMVYCGERRAKYARQKALSSSEAKHSTEVDELTGGVQIRTRYGEEKQQARAGSCAIPTLCLRPAVCNSRSVRSHMLLTPVHFTHMDC